MPNTPNPTDPNYLSWLLTHLSQGSDPNYKQNIKAYDQYSGLPVDGRYQGYNAARYLLPAIYKQLADQTGFYNGLQPLAHQNVNSLLTQLSNPSQMADSYQSKVNAQAGSTLQSVLLRLKSGGAGIGAMQGAAVSSQNQANTAANQFRAQQDSPEGRASRLNAILGLIASQNPNFNNLQALHGIETNTPRSAPGGLDILSGVLQGAGQDALNGIDWGRVFTR
jgi:hypothetical protein